jgi:hypothetical protein
VLLLIVIVIRLKISGMLPKKNKMNGKYTTKKTIEEDKKNARTKTRKSKVKTAKRTKV